MTDKAEANGLRPWLVWGSVALVCGLLGVEFVRALPAAVERQRAGREAAQRAVCEPALRPEPHNPALGPIAQGTVDAPEFKLQDWAGRDVALSSLRGRVVVLNLWATWCPTCVVEMPSLDQLAVAEKGRPVSIVAVSVDEDWDAVRRFFASGTTLTVLLDKDKTVPPRYGTEKYPETFIIDRDGKVRYYVVSDRNWASPDIRACLDELARG
jgi:thiol-disulfide isomerase/thioredoxin